MSSRTKVRRRSPVLVAPADPTPHELKPLSDIDSQHGNRFHIFLLHFFRGPSMGRDPARAVRKGLAGALVHYYPLAGRLREGRDGKLVVECTGEGVLFVEADADVRLESIGEPPVAAASLAAELIHNVEGSAGITGCPLLLIQVTRLVCGGFVLGIRLNHAIADGRGLVQFLRAACELSQGASQPSLRPVWCRELLNARTPPRPTHPHREYDQVVVIDAKCALPPLDRLQRRYIFFGPAEMSALRKRLPPRLSGSSTFEMVTACNWLCRTAALRLHPEQEVRATFTVSVRGRPGSPLPVGYYGNAFATPTAVCAAGALCGGSLELGYAHALELVREAKSQVDGGYLQSVADLMALKGGPHHSMVHTYFASDARGLAFDRVDFGWGAPVYDLQVLANRSSFYVKAKNGDGRAGLLVSVCLPAPEMDNFLVELSSFLLVDDDDDDDDGEPPPHDTSNSSSSRKSGPTLSSL